VKVVAGLGLFEFPFSGAGAFWRWVDLCEAGGVDSLWHSDRLCGDTPALECMSVMAALAGATRRLKFGMNVASAGLRDPLLLACQCATIDTLSDGRLLPAFGVGSPHSADWSATQTPTRLRGRRTDEALDIIAALWRGERVTYQGEVHRVRDALISPLPVQRVLPLWIGGSSAAAIRRTARVGTGWMGARETPAEASAVVRAIRDAAAERGRTVPEDHYGIGLSFRLGGGGEALLAAETARVRKRAPERDPRASMVVGDAAQLLERMGEYVRVGVTKFVLRPIARGDEDVLEQTRRFVETVLPGVDGLSPAGRGR
jgi:probable F420-dependent oxidoreductase